MFVEEITYGTFVGGQMNGVVGFTIEFGGDPGDKDDNELLAVLEGIYRHHRGKGRFILLSGEFTEENSLDILTLVRSLINAKFLVGAISNGTQYHSWFTQLQFLVVDTYTNRWVGFEVNEIWYHIEEDDSEELVLPELAQVPRLYLVPGPNVTPVGLFRFLKGSKHIWNIHLEPEQPFTEVVQFGGNN